MVTYETAAAVADLTQEEIEAIAEHENLPEMAALELGNYLCQTEDGERALKGMILDDLEAARERGDKAGAARLKLALRQFVDSHPRAAGKVES